jgi:hypothetical protein
MRLLALGSILFLVTISTAQDQQSLSKRYGFDANLTYYPQKTPRDTLLSVANAFDNNRVDYLLAQLAEPRFVDDAVAGNKTTMRQRDDKAKVFLAFDRLVAETTQYLRADPTLLKDLRHFAADAEWETTDKEAVGTLKSIQGRKVYLRKLSDRWFLENKQ